MKSSRRQFLKRTSIGFAAANLVLADRSFASANDQIGLGFIGAGGRAGELSSSFAKSKNAKVIAIADPDSERGVQVGLELQREILFRSS